jgi:Uma2 family endonuclease
VKYYWIADPKPRTMEGYKLVGGKYRLTGKGKNGDVLHLPPFDDLEIALRDVWQPR